jgi:hypothetical protein
MVMQSSGFVSDFHQTPSVDAFPATRHPPAVDQIKNIPAILAPKNPAKKAYIQALGRRR